MMTQDIIMKTTKWLYKGRKQISTMDVFPSKFKAYLEDVLVKELKTNRFNYIAIYYRHDEKPDELRYEEFDKNEWLLSEGLQMSPNDIYVMEKYKESFLNFFDRCVNMLKCYEKDKDYGYRYRDVKKERDRIINMMNSS